MSRAPAVDGRRARRERGRVAVTDALLDLVQEGASPPTAEQIAERAGVSVASLYRYYPTLDDLRDEAIARFVDRFADLLSVADTGDGALEARIDRFVTARLRLYGTIGPLARFSRSRAYERPPLAAALGDLHRRHADLVRQHFGPELDPRPASAREDLVAAAVALTSFDSWALLHDDLGRSRTQVARTWRVALRRILGPT